MQKQKKTAAVFISFLFVLVTSVSSYGASATFSWIANEDAPTGYKIYYGTGSRNYNSVVDVGSPDPVDGRVVGTVEGLADGQTYFFAATAYTATEESDYSTEVEYTTPQIITPDPLMAGDLTLQTSEDTPVTGTVETNGDAGDTLTLTVVGSPSHGTVALQGTNGTFSYTPAANYHGSDSFTFTVSNGSETTAPASASITILPVNDYPTADNQSIVVQEDGLYSGNLSASDVDGDSLSFTSSSLASKGIVAVNSNGTFTYRPNSNVTGTDSFTFSASDGTVQSSSATVSITINPVNDAPVVGNLAVSVDENHSYTGQLSGTDQDNDTLSFSAASQPANGSLALSGNGAFTYTPNQNYNGSDSFTYRASDGSLQSNTATVSITVDSINYAPVVGNLAVSVNENASYTGQLSGTDQDNDTLSFTAVSQPANGSVSINANGSFTYTPTTYYSGNDQFTFKASDGSTDSNVGTVSVIVNAIARDFAYEVGELLVTTEWQQVNFDTAFIDPAVVVNATTVNSAVPVLVSIRSLNSTGFEVRLNSWPSESAPDQAEIVTFFAMEKGIFEVADGIHAAAGCAEVSGLNSFTPVSFPGSMSTVPVVMTSVASSNDEDVVTVRVQGISGQGFSAALQEQEANDGFHGSETVCYIGWEKWSGMLDGNLVEIAAVADPVSHAGTTVSFSQQYPTLPFVVAGMQSTNGLDPALLEVSNLEVNSMTVSILEEQSADSEVEHSTETAGYFALVPYNDDEDSDQDGLTNVEELELGTHPGIADTDKDGIDDGEELQYLLDNSLDSSTDSDNDGTANLLDADSDNDGILDGAEIAQGSDPTVPNDTDTEEEESAPEFNYEVGEVLGNHEPVHVQFSKPFSNPVVIANVITRNDRAPVVVRVDNVSPEGFDVQVQEYDYLDGTHTDEIVSYIVLEEGIHTLEDGSVIEAGIFEGSGEPAEISFNSEFSVPPVVMTSTVSMNSGEAVAERVWDVSTINFKHVLQEQEASRTQHGMETVSYIAWTPGTGIINGLRFEAGTTPRKVTNRKYTIRFDQQFTGLPFHFAAMQAKNGEDTSIARIMDTGQTSMVVKIEEEKSADRERRHTREVVGYLILAQE